jgi:hypothetical protein
MPRFDRRIQDLIGRMMQVDPARRITMAEIKRHDAFRYGLPSDYVIPAPIPFANFCDPIDPASLSEEIQRTLGEIGIEPQEVEEALRSSESNMMKVLVMLMMQRVQLEDIPWEQALTSLGEGISMEPPTEFGSATIGHEQLRRASEGPMPDLLSNESMSLARKVEFWVDGDTEYCFDVDEEIHSAGPGSLVELMRKLQLLLLRNGFGFFHPNDVQLIGRMDKNTYVRLDAEVRVAEGISVRVQMKGVTPEVKNLPAQIYEIMNEGA